MRTKKAVINAFASILYQIVAMICGLITPRLILATFGSTYNGVISSANQFLSMISFLTLGIAGATRVALYKPLAEKNLEKISGIVKSNKLYMRKVGIAIIFYAIILTIIYPFISHNDLTRLECSAIIGIVSIGVFAQYFFGVSNQTLLSADQRGYIYYFIQTIATIVNTIVSVILIRLGNSIFVVKFGSSIIFFLSPLVLNYLVKRKYKLLNNCAIDNSAIEQRGAVAFHSIANIIHDHTDLVVLTLFTDATVISVFTVYNSIIAKIRQLILLLTNGLEGAFGNMWAQKEYDAFERNFRFFEFLIFTFTSVVFTTVAIMIIPFMRLYTKGVNDANYILFDFALLFTIAEAMRCIRHPYLIVVQATGNYEGTKGGALAEAIINIVSSVILVIFIGINGVIIGTLIANTFRTVQYSLYISKRIIKGSIKGSAKHFLWCILNSLLIFYGQYFVEMNYPVSSWIHWIYSGILNLIIAILITTFTSFIVWRNDLISLLGMIRRLIK